MPHGGTTRAFARLRRCGPEVPTGNARVAPLGGTMRNVTLFESASVGFFPLRAVGTSVCAFLAWNGSAWAFPSDVDLATGRAVTASSIYPHPDGAADHAVDGST